MPTLKNPIDKKSQDSETKGGFTNERSSELERWKNQVTILRLTVVREARGVGTWQQRPPTKSGDGEDRAGRLV